MKVLLALVQRYRKLPSEILHIEDPYDAYCLDEACAYVMSELDAGRRQQLLSFIGREGIQTLITATDEAYFDMPSVERYFRVAAGSVAGAGYGKADG